MFTIIFKLTCIIQGQRMIKVREEVKGMEKVKMLTEGWIKLG